MTKKNITISALAAVLVLSVSAFAFAGPGYGRGYGGGCPGYAAQLTPENEAAAQAVYDKYEPQFTELRNAMWTKHSVLQAMINDGDSNEKKIGKLTSEMTALRDQMRQLRVTMNTELAAAIGVDATQLRGGRGFACGGAQFQGDCPGGGYGRGGMGRGMGRGMGPGFGMGPGQF